MSLTRKGSIRKTQLSMDAEINLRSGAKKWKESFIINLTKKLMKELKFITN